MQKGLRFLLINPAMNLKKLGRFAGLLEPMPCIGLAYIAGALEAHGTNVAVIDMFADRLSADEVVQRSREYNPDVIGMTVLTPSEPVCSILVSMIKAVLPNVKIVWGAVHAEVFAKDIVQEGKADFVVHHDGEETICELVDALESGETDFSSIDGLTWLAEGTPITNKDRRLLRDLDSLPYPAWHLFPYEKYGLLPFADFAKPVLTMTGS